MAGKDECTLTHGEEPGWPQVCPDCGSTGVFISSLGILAQNNQATSRQFIPGSLENKRLCAIALPQPTGLYNSVCLVMARPPLIHFATNAIDLILLLRYESSSEDLDH